MNFTFTRRRKLRGTTFINKVLKKPHIYLYRICTDVWVPLLTMSVCIPGRCCRRDVWRSWCIRLTAWWSCLNRPWNECILNKATYDWDLFLPYMLFIVQKFPQASTGFTLLELLIGQVQTLRNSPTPIFVLGCHQSQTHLSAQSSEAPESRGIAHSELGIRNTFYKASVFCDSNHWEISAKICETLQHRQRWCTFMCARMSYTHSLPPSGLFLYLWRGGGWAVTKREGRWARQI